ncbi:MAG: dockerin type I domain-containing protein [Candidatus Kapaibacterium sp.]
MRYYFIFVMALILAVTRLSGQTLRFDRTDVDMARSGFVTATYLFGVDVIAEAVENCNSVSFRLVHDQTDYVKFSGYSETYFTKTGGAVSIIHKTDPSTGSAMIEIGALSGTTPGDTVFDEPAVIHLEFAVTQSAPHLSELTFEFLNPQATVFSDTTGEIIELDTESISYNIHSFIDAWPGDANNDGVVDTRDISTIGLYLGIGPKTKSMRSFRRHNPSAIWAPQPVLAWDSAMVSYADCDGNGEITVTDILIVNLNHDSTHAAAKEVKGNAEIQSDCEYLNKKFDPEYARIPCKISTHEKYNAIAGSIPIFDDLGNEIAGIEKNSDAGYVFQKIENGRLYFSIGRIGNKGYIDSEEPFNYVVKLADPASFNPEAELKAINSYGVIFTPDKATSVEENVNTGLITHAGDFLEIPPVKKSCFLYIFSLHGGLAQKTRLVPGSTSVYVGGLARGTYLVKIEGSAAPAFIFTR